MIFWVNIHQYIVLELIINNVLVQDQYKLRTYAKTPIIIIKTSPDMAAPRNVYFGVKSSF